MCFIRTVSWFSAHDRKENDESWELTSCTVPEKVTITFETSRGFVRTTSTKYNYSNKMLPICMAYRLNYFKDNFQGPGCKSCKMCSTDNFALRLSATCKRRLLFTHTKSYLVSPMFRLETSPVDLHSQIILNRWYLLLPCWLFWWFWLKLFFK